MIDSYRWNRYPIHGSYRVGSAVRGAVAVHIAVNLTIVHVFRIRVSRQVGVSARI
jgi:hypothetical protein